MSLFQMKKKKCKSNRIYFVVPTKQSILTTKQSYNWESFSKHTKKKQKNKSKKPNFEQANELLRPLEQFILVLDVSTYLDNKPQ